MAPDYLSLLAMEWFKWEDREGRRLTKWSHASMVAMAKCRFIATILLLGSSLRVSNYRRRAECAPRLPSERRRSRSPHGTAV